MTASRILTAGPDVPTTPRVEASNDCSKRRTLGEIQRDDRHGPTYDYAD